MAASLSRPAALSRCPSSEHLAIVATVEVEVQSGAGADFGNLEWQAGLSRYREEARQQHRRPRDLVGLRHAVEGTAQSLVVTPYCLGERVAKPGIGNLPRRIHCGEPSSAPLSTSACRAPSSLIASASAVALPGQPSARRPVAVERSNPSASARQTVAEKGEPSASQVAAWASRCRRTAVEGSVWSTTHLPSDIHVAMGI